MTPPALHLADLAPLPRGDQQSFRHSLPPLLALALAMALAFTMMNSFSTVQEGAKAELGLSDYALGLIQGVATAIPLLCLAIPIGIAVDRWKRVQLLLALAITWTAGTGLTAIAGGFATLFVARMMTAIGMAGGLTAALSLAADLCRPDQRGRATLIVTVGKTLGQALTFALAAALFGLFAAKGAPTAWMPAWLTALPPWRATHVLLFLIGAVLMLPLFLMREPVRRETEAGTRAPIADVVRELWGRRRFLGPLFAGQVSIVMADAAGAVWAAPVLSRGYGVQPFEVAGWMGLLLFGTGLGGAILGGIAADMGQRKGGLMMGAVIAAAAGIPASLFPLCPTVPTFALALGMLLLCGTVTGLIVSVALTVLLPNEVRGLCIGAFVAVAGLIGFGVAPTMVAVVSRVLGGETHLGQALALVGAIVSAAGLTGFCLAMRNAPPAVAKPF